METWKNGPHLLELEPPDIFRCHVRGPVEEAEAKETMRIIGDLVSQRGKRVFFVAEMEFNGSSNPFTPAARKYIQSLTPMWKAMIVVGGNALSRAATNIVVNGMMLFSKKQVPFKMLKSMDEAREYMTEFRRQEAPRAAASNG